MAENVGGTINVEVMYRESGGAPAGLGGAPSSAGGTGNVDARRREKQEKTMGQQANMWLRKIGISLTAGEMVRRSKVAGSMLGTLLDLFGLLIDVFLMPFIPLLIPLLKNFAKIVGWLAKFMVDPYGALRDLWEGLINYFKTGWDDIWSNITSPDWQAILGGLKSSPETILPLLVGGAGLLGATKIAGHLFGDSGVFGTGLLGVIKTLLGLGDGGGGGDWKPTTPPPPPGGGKGGGTGGGNPPTPVPLPGDRGSPGTPDKKPPRKWKLPKIPGLASAAAVGFLIAEFVLLTKVFGDGMNSMQRYNATLDKMPKDQSDAMRKFVDSLATQREGEFDSLTGKRRQFEFIQSLFTGRTEELLKSGYFGKEGIDININVNQDGIVTDAEAHWGNTRWRDVYAIYGE